MLGLSSISSHIGTSMGHSICDHSQSLVSFIVYGQASEQPSLEAGRKRGCTYHYTEADGGCETLDGVFETNLDIEDHMDRQKPLFLLLLGHRFRICCACNCLGIS
jgi:hypothetical protein